MATYQITDFNRKQQIEELIVKYLNEEEPEIIEQLFIDFADILYLEGDKLILTNGTKHYINTKDANFLYKESYGYPLVLKEEVRNQVSKMLEQSIIRPSNSQWSTIVCIHPKKFEALGEQK